MEWFRSLTDVEGLAWVPPLEVTVDPVLAAMTPRPRTREFVESGEIDWIAEFVEPGSLVWAAGDDILDFMKSPSHRAFSGLYGVDQDEEKFVFIIKALMLPGTIADYLDAALIGARNLTGGGRELELHQTAIAIIDSDPARAARSVEAAGGSPEEVFLEPFGSGVQFLLGQGFLREAIALDDRARSLTGGSGSWQGQMATDTLKSLEEIAEARSK
jgi:hypothetical protein